VILIGPRWLIADAEVYARADRDSSIGDRLVVDGRFVPGSEWKTCTKKGEIGRVFIPGSLRRFDLTTLMDEETKKAYATPHASGPPEDRVHRDLPAARPAKSVKVPWTCASPDCKTPTAGPSLRVYRTFCTACADVFIHRAQCQIDTPPNRKAREPASVPPASPATMGGSVFRPGGRWGQYR